MTTTELLIYLAFTALACLISYQASKGRFGKSVLLIDFTAGPDAIGTEQITYNNGHPLVPDNAGYYRYTIKKGVRKRQLKRHQENDMYWLKAFQGKHGDTMYKNGVVFKGLKRFKELVEHDIKAYLERIRQWQAHANRLESLLNNANMRIKEEETEKIKLLKKLREVNATFDPKKK